MCYQDEPPHDMLEEASIAIATAVEAAKAKPRCEAITGHAAGPYGEMTVRCGQTVGVARFTDMAGYGHAACAYHMSAMRSLWP